MEGGESHVNIEERVVQMKMDHQQFQQGAAETLNTLGKLKEGLKLDGASKGLDEVSNAANRFSLDGMKNQLSGIMGHFSALQVAAVTAFATMVHSAVAAGAQIVKSLTIDPVKQGFREYETQLNAIQTIMANTGLEGAAGLAKVTEKLDELNHYSDQTIYNFTEMAKNIGTFTAAGVNLDKSTAAIKGIANLAAVSGSNSQQASTAMYQLSQALSAGKVSLEDWNSVVNAGMGGKIFRDSLIETAKVHGVKIDEIIKKQGSFRNSIQEGWITTDILAETLSKFTGDLSEEQLKSLGYTKQQIDGIMKMGKTATDAATKVKTMTQLLDTLREGATSGWAKTWQIIFGDFDEARGMFTEVSNVLGGAINQMSDARNELLQGWKDLGGRDALIDGIAAAFQALLSVLKPIAQAFREMFPAATAEQLYRLTVSFRDFMERLKMGEQSANDLRRTFAGLFAIFGIGWDLIKAVAGFIGDMIGKFSGGGDKVLRFTGNIGDFIVAIRKALQEGQFFERFFDKLGVAISFVYDLVAKFAHLIGNAFKKLDLAPAEEMAARLLRTAEPSASLGEKLAAIWDRVANFMTNAMNAAYEGVKKVWTFFQDILKSVRESFGGGGESGGGNLLAGINTAGFITFITLMYNFFKNFKPAEFLDSLIDSFEALTGALRGMQHALNAAALLGIAAAIGILAASMEKLSKIDQAGLVRASAAIAVLMTELAAAFILFDKVGGTLGAAKLIVVSTALIRLGAALLILVTAVEKLAKLSWNELAKGLTGIMVLMGALVAGVKFLPTDIAGVVKTATGLLVLSFAIRNLDDAVAALGKLDWQTLAKGLVGVATLLASLALFTKFASTNGAGILQGAGIILIATGIKILASAVGDFVQFNWEQLARGMAAIAVGLGLIAAALYLIPPTALLSAAGVLVVAASLGMIADGVKEMSKMSWGEIGKGLTVMAGALLAIAVAIGFLPPTSLLSAVGVFIVAASLGMLYEALSKMGKMSWDEIGKSLLVLAASLLVISGALFVTQGAVGGAVAIAIIAASLLLLVPALQKLGDMSWESIVKGLTALAGIFVVLGAVGLFIGPLAPLIMGLAASIMLLGAAVLFAGVGVLAFATGLGILAAVGATSTAAVIGIVSGLVGLIPFVMEQIGLGLIAFSQVIMHAGPAMMEAMTVVLVSIIDAIIAVTPKIGALLLVLLDLMLDIIVKSQPKMVDAGLELIKALLRGIAEDIGEMSDLATDAIVNFIDGIGRNLPRINQAGVDLIFSFLNGIADSINKNSYKMGEAGWNIAEALVMGIVRGIAGMASRAVQSAIDLAKSIGKSAMDALGIKSPSRVFSWIAQMLVQGLVLGMQRYGSAAVDATAAVGEDVVDAMKNTLSNLSVIAGSELMDFSPTISPVLDLSAVRKDAHLLSDLLAVGTLDVASSALLAQQAAAAYEQNREDDGTSAESRGGDTYNFTQTNYSPKALPEAEIYRKTKNLISQKEREAANA